MTLGVILRPSRRIWPTNDEILRFAQNDSFAVSFENLNIRILRPIRQSSGQALLRTGFGIVSDLETCPRENGD